MLHEKWMSIVLAIIGVEMMVFSEWLLTVVIIADGTKTGFLGSCCETQGSFGCFFG